MTIDVNSITNPLGFKPRKEYITYTDAIDITGEVKTPPASRAPGISAIEKAKDTDISLAPERKLPSEMTSQVRTIQDAQLPSSLNRSPTTGAIERIPDSTPIVPSAEKSLADLVNAEKEANRAKLGIAGAKFFLDVMNANSAYESFKTATKMNVDNARFEAEEARQRGRERAMVAMSEGRRAGEDVTLSMAAQGQDVMGAATQTAQESLDVIAAYNAMNEETNSIREALGYKLQEIQFGFDLDQRRVERDTTILSSALNFGATAYAYRNLI